MPWAIRNYIIFHAFIPTNLAYGLDLAAGNHSGASGELEPHEISGQLIEQYGYLKANSLLLREAVGFIFSHPLEFLKITFTGYQFISVLPVLPVFGFISTV